MPAEPEIEQIEIYVDGETYAGTLMRETAGPDQYTFSLTFQDKTVTDDGIYEGKAAVRERAESHLRELVWHFLRKGLPPFY